LKTSRDCGHALVDLSHSALIKLRPLNAPLGWAALYLASGLLVALLQPADGPYLWYPPIAIGIVTMLRHGLRCWPLLLVADFFVSLRQYGTPEDALVLCVCTVIELVVAVYALRRFNPNFTISDHRDLARLSAICVATGFLGASLGSGTFHLIYGADGLSVEEWIGWWFGDATSGVSLLPLLLVLTAKGREPAVAPRWLRANWEGAGLLATAILIAYVSSGHAALLPLPLQDTLAPLLFAPVIWAALRFDMRMTALTLMTIAISAVLFRWWDGFVTDGGALSAHDVVRAQIFLAALSIIGMSLSLALHRERRARGDAEQRAAELRAASDRLCAALMRLSMAAKAGHIGIWDWDFVDDDTQWDEQIYAMYQIDPNTQDKTASWRERLHPDDAPRVEEEFQELVRGGKELRSSYRIVWPSGEVRYIISQGVVQPNASGRSSWLIGIDYDVTDLVRQRLKAEENELRAAAANRAKSEFLAIMSHELRTPLNAIIGFSDLMARGAFGALQNERYSEYIQDINRSGHLLLSLINDILDLTRIEAGKRELSLEAIEPVAVLGDVARLLAPLAQQKNIRLSVIETGPDQALIADPRALRQLLNNLVTNAIKFSDDGAVVTLATEPAAPGRVTLVVADNGRGIPRERIQDLCKPFVQIADPLRRDVGGIGLGLAISRSLTEAMRGTLDLESELGKGTTVRISLPAA
jgi:signal transduction histidine kinase/integral membrane sensor domain MASE1